MILGLSIPIGVLELAAGTTGFPKKPREGLGQLRVEEVRKWSDRIWGESYLLTGSRLGDGCRYWISGGGLKEGNWQRRELKMEGRRIKPSQLRVVFNMYEGEGLGIEKQWTVQSGFVLACEGTLEAL